MTEVVAEITIERISFDYGVEFLGSDGSVVRIEGEASVTSPGSSPLTFDAESVGPAASVLLGFLHREVKLALNDGTLELAAAENGLALLVGPAPSYEAWSAVLADGSRLVCTDDGTVARWAAP